MKSTGTLKEIIELIQISKGVRVYQFEFLDDILPILTRKVLPMSKGDWKSGSASAENSVELKGKISSIFRKNKNQKIPQWKYAAFRKEIVDQRGNIFKNGVIKQMKKGLEAYIDFDAWTRYYPREVYESITDELEPREYTPLEILCYILQISDTYWPGEENTYREQLQILLNNYNGHNSKSTLFQLLIYAILCSIFPDPNYINAYKLPKLFQNTETIDSYKENRKVKLFMGHQAVSCIEQVLEKSGMAYVLGGDGCGKESIVRTLAYTLAETHNFYYYKFDYDGEILYENSIAIANFEEVRERIIDSIDLSEKIPVLIISNWNGRRDSLYKKIVKGIQAKKILLTSNELLLNDIETVGQIIDLNHDFFSDRKQYSEKIFNEITGLNIGSSSFSIEETRKAEELLEKVGYHFYSSILLAKTISKSECEGFAEFYEQSHNGNSIYAEEDILPYIRNIGLDVSETLSNFLVVLSLIPNGTMKEDFFFNLLEMNIQEKRKYKHAIRSGQEKSLLYIDKRNVDGKIEIVYKIYPHIKQAIMALPSFGASEFLHMFHISVAEKIEMLTMGENTALPPRFSDELISLVRGVLENLPYKAGKYTSFYLTYIRFLWVYADLPMESLKFLNAIEREIGNRRIHLLNTDLCQIYRTFGHIYASVGDDESAQKYLERVVEKERVSFISSNALLESAKIRNSAGSNNGGGVYTIETRDLKFLEKHSMEDTYEMMALKMQISKMYINKLKEGKSQLLDPETAFAYLDDCIVFFKARDYQTALATSYYLRAVLLRIVAPSEIQNIVDDLNQAEELRKAIRGENHSFMLPIYFEKAEMAIELLNREMAEMYYQLIKNIQNNPKGDYSLTMEEMQRINRLENQLVYMRCKNR